VDPLPKVSVQDFITEFLWDNSIIAHERPEVGLLTALINTVSIPHPYDLKKLNWFKSSS
jgi:hypothetical protein